MTASQTLGPQQRDFHTMSSWELLQPPAEISQAEEPTGRTTKSSRDLELPPPPSFWVEGMHALLSVCRVFLGQYYCRSSGVIY